MFGKVFGDLERYNELVELYTQGEGRDIEEEIEKLKPQIRALDERAAENGKTSASNGANSRGLSIPTWGIRTTPFTP